MTSGSLLHPEWLNAFALALLVCATALWFANRLALRRRRRLLAGRPAANPRTLSSDVALFLAGVAISIAILGPRIGERSVRVPYSGTDVVFLVDVSRSMDARDTPPSRLDRARRAVEEILVRLPAGDRAGLAAFAGRGLLLAPLTPDRDALADLLAALDSDLIEPASSNLATGVDAALTAFEDGSDRPRVVVVMSDGEDPTRNRDIGAEAARAFRARVLTIALGSEVGGIVPDGARSLRDRNGEIVHSRRRIERLARLAAETDGEAFVGDAWGRVDFARAVASIQRDAGSAAADGWIEQRVAAIGSVPFAAIAFALLLLEGLPRPRRRRAPTAFVATIAALLAAGAHGGEPLQLADRNLRAQAIEAAATRALAHPHDARAQLELGLANLAAGRNEAAMRAFQASTVFSRDAEITAVAYFDLGVAALANDDRDTARDAFFAALEIDPSDDQARFNLEWTLHIEPEAEPEPPPRSQSLSRPGGAEADSQVEQGDAGESAETGRNSTPAPPTLSDAQRRRWLERAEDDARHWLRAAAATPDEAGSRSKRPAW